MFVMSDGNDNNNEIETELFRHKQKDHTIQKLFFNLLDCMVFFIVTHFVLLLEFSSKAVLSLLLLNAIVATLVISVQKAVLSPIRHKYSKFKK